MLLSLGVSLALHGALLLVVSRAPDRGMPPLAAGPSIRVTASLLSSPVRAESRPAAASPLPSGARRETAEAREPSDMRGATDRREAEEAPIRERAAVPEPSTALDDQLETDGSPDPVAAAIGREGALPSETTGPEEVDFSAATAGLGLTLPPYPEIARRWGYEGRVLVRIQVAADGRISDASVLRSSGHAVLDSACLDTIRKKWRFPAPGREIAMSKEFEFRLRR